MRTSHAMSSARALLLILGVGAPSAVAGEPIRLRAETAELAPGGQRTAVGTLELSRDAPEAGAGSSGTFSVFVEGASGYLPSSVGFYSEGPAGESLDQLGPVPFEPRPCPPSAGPKSACAAAGPIRLVGGRVDRGHPLWRESSLLARVGGRVLVTSGAEWLTLPVAGPHEFGGAVHGLRTRVRVLRAGPNGDPALDVDPGRSLALAQLGLDEANSIWEQCGFVLAPRETSDFLVVTPPTTQVLEVGCHGGLPASGGSIRLSTSRGVVELTTRPGERPASVAGRLAIELSRRGLRVTLAENARSEESAGPTYDLVVQGRSGPELGPATGAGPSTDRTLDVCLGELDLADGLEHFEDETAKAGTLEERVLLRGLGERPKGSVDVVLVPYFAGRGRIGESFIGGGGASLENFMILDRAGLRASARSSTWAHELGHVLLALPGHPDDFGLDEPARLMDADASDATAFGPRRLELEECRRALREHGPASLLPLLELQAPQKVPEAAASGRRAAEREPSR